MDLYNFDAGQYDTLDQLPATLEGLLPYIDNTPDLPDVARNLLRCYVALGMEPIDAYIEVMQRMVGHKS